MTNKPLLNLLQTHHKKPLIQAPMAGAQDSRLAIAVNLAGGLGSLPCAMLDLTQIAEQVQAMRQADDSPVHLNFFAHTPSDYDEQMHKRWRNRLLPYYHKMGLDGTDIALTGGRQPFTQAQLELVLDLGVEMVSFHFGLPDETLLQPLKQKGVLILSTATTLEEANYLAKKGVDGIIAQGLEAGGHRGAFLSRDLSKQLPTFALLPQIAQAHKNSPIAIIAAGGISDHHTAKASFMLGADLVQVGTAFLLADESNTTDFHRQALQSPMSQHTALTNLFSGGVARGIVTDFMRDLAFINDDVPPFPHAGFVVNDLKAKLKNNPNNELKPEYFTSLWAGQNAPLAKAGSARQIIERILNG